MHECTSYHTSISRSPNCHPQNKASMVNMLHTENDVAEYKIYNDGFFGANIR